MNKTIRAQDFAAVIAEDIEILVDDNKRRGQVIGLKVNPVDAESFIMPIAFPTAKALAIFDP